MSNTMFRRAAPAAMLAMLSTPSWSQTFYHAPPAPPDNGSYLLSMPSLLGTSTSSVGWSGESNWSPSPISYALPSTGSTGPKPLPSRLHSSAFVFKRPTYRMQPSAETSGAPHFQPGMQPPAAPPATPMVQTPYGPRPAPPSMTGVADPSIYAQSQSAYPQAPMAYSPESGSYPPPTGAYSQPPGGAAYPGASPQAAPPTYPLPNQPVAALPHLSPSSHAPPAPPAAPPAATEYTSTSSPPPQVMTPRPNAITVDANRARGAATEAFARGDFAAAEQMLAEAWGQHPGDVSLAAMLARAREGQGDWGGATHVYNALVEMEPSQRRWRAQRAECHYQTGRYDLAVADYRAAAVAVRLSHDEFARFGDAAMRIGDYTTAEKALSALSKGSDQPVPQVELLRGIALLRQGHHREARDLLLRASGKWPDDATITEALRIASAAHYGNRPLPDIDLRRRRQDERHVVNADVTTVMPPTAQPNPMTAAPVNTVPVSTEPTPTPTGPPPTHPPGSPSTSPASPIFDADADDPFNSVVTPPTATQGAAESNPTTTVIAPQASWRATRPAIASEQATSPESPTAVPVTGNDAHAEGTTTIIAASAEQIQTSPVDEPEQADPFSDVRDSSVSRSPAKGWKATDRP